MSPGQDSQRHTLMFSQSSEQVIRTAWGVNLKYRACKEKPKETLKCLPEPKNWMSRNNANKKEFLKLGVLP